MFEVLKSTFTALTNAGASDNSCQLATVQLGEKTLEQVARRLNVDPDALRQANPQIKDPSNLKVGQDIYMPLGTDMAPKPKPAPSAPVQPPSNSSPAPTGDPLAASAMKAKVNQAATLPADEQYMLQTLGEGTLREYQKAKAFRADFEKDIVDAHKIYEKTGQIPQTRYPHAWIEIKEGKSLNQAERYDRYLASQGMGPHDLRIGQLDPSNRDEFMTRDEFKDEYAKRLEEAKDYFKDACPTRYHSTQQIEDCQAKVMEKYAGQDGVDHYRSRMAKAKQAGREYEQHIESVKGGGPFSMIGRAIDMALGGDGETGAAAGGMVDTGAAIKAGRTEMVRQQKYKGTGGLEVRREPAAEIRSKVSSNSSENMPRNPAGEGEGVANNGGKQLPATADDSSPRGPAKGAPGNVKGQVLVGTPIAPGPPRPADNVKVTINTSKGPVEMTAGEYRRLHEQAEKWISGQMQDYHWGNGGQRPDQQEMTKKAAEKFGLDAGWRSINNPIIYGGKI